jgi:hypothetical protein
MIRIIRGEEVDGPRRDKRGHGIFEYHADGYPQVCGFSHQPLLDACRQLKSLYGVTAQAAGLFREGRDTPDLTCSVDVGAATTVSEPDNGSIRFAKYKAFPQRVRTEAETPVLASDSQAAVSGAEGA